MNEFDPYRRRVVTVTPPARFSLLGRGDADWNEEISNVHPNIGRYTAEVMAIQQCLGVKADGIIGPETRDAARKIALARHMHPTTFHSFMQIEE
jgi:hypothetical protein